MSRSQIQMAAKLFRPALIDVRINLTPTELRDASSNMDEYLLKKLRKRLEEKCSIHGYVRKGSTQILARSMGQAEHSRYTGDFLFVCKVRVLCFLPEAGQIVDAKILMMNKSGGYALLIDNGTVSEAIRILIPRELHLGNIEFDSLTEGQMIKVKLQASRFQENDSFITSVGVYEGPSTVEIRDEDKGVNPTAPATPANFAKILEAAAPVSKGGVNPTAPATPANFAKILEAAEPKESKGGVNPTAPATPANFAKILEATSQTDVKSGKKKM